MASDNPSWEKVMEVFMMSIGPSPQRTFRRAPVAGNRIGKPGGSTLEQCRLMSRAEQPDRAAELSAGHPGCWMRVLYARSGKCCQQGHQLAEHLGAGRDDVALVQVGRFAVELAADAARFRHQQGTGRDVPGLQV